MMSWATHLLVEEGWGIAMLCYAILSDGGFLALIDRSFAEGIGTGVYLGIEGVACVRVCKIH